MAGSGGRTASFRHNHATTETGGTLAEDDGLGIPEHPRAEVFEPGYSTADDGAGVGLNIAREIVKAHGWEIRATDGSEGGARFEITGVEFDT